MRKRRLSAVLALVLALTMSFSSFATEITDETAVEEAVGVSEEVTSKEESASTDESSSTEENVLTEESSSTEENTSTEESSSTEENTSTEESSSTEESTSTEESSSTEESTSTEESSSTEESTSTEESSSTEENASTEEASSTEENVQTEEGTDESIENVAAEETTSGDESESEEVDSCETDGHTYVAGSWTWVNEDGEVSASLVFVCEVCGDEISVDADVSIADEQEATAYEEGWITYEAVAALDGETYTDEYVVTLPIDVGEEEEEVETGCAADTVTSSTSNGLLVTISWSDNAFDETPEVSVSDISKDVAIAAVEEAVDDEDCEVIDAVGVDITFSISGEEVQPYSPVTVSIELPASQVLETAGDEADTEVVVVHQHDDEQAEILSDASATEEGASFEADLFSYYVIGTYSSSSSETTIADSAAGLQAAINAISESDEKTGTIVITTDINCGTTTINIPSGVTVTLTDNGSAHSITCTATSTKSLFKVASGGTLIIDGKNLTIERDDTSATKKTTKYGALIECHGTLTLNSGTIDYKNVNLYHSASESPGSETTGGAVVVSKDGALFTMNGGTIKNATCTSSYSGLVRVCNGGSFVMNGGEITGFSGTSEGVTSAAVMIYTSNLSSSASATFTMTGGTISGNKNTTDDYCNGSGVVLYCENDHDCKVTFKMTGGSIEKNEAAYGGGIYACGSVELTISGGSIEDNSASVNGGGICFGGNDYKKTLTMTGGSIKNNKAESDGGGISGYVDYTYLNLNGGTISNNTSSASGGGVVLSGTNSKLVIDGATISGNTASTVGGGIAKYNADFEMKSGIIENNEAGTAGGGIYINHVDNNYISGGTIEDNTANTHGGGIYINDGTLYLENVLITDNTAGVLGGGIWGCNTSGIELYVTNGGAIFGNDATGDEKTSSQAGDDYASVSKDENEYTMYLSDRILGGGYAEWYVDGGIDTSSSSTTGYADTSATRYDDESESEHTAFSASSITQTSSYALINAIDEGDSNEVLYTESDGTVVYAATALSEAEAGVIITGNSALRGGGIGANGNVVIGTNKTTSLTVTKVWNDGGDASSRPESITLYLFNTVTTTNEAGSETETKYLLQTVELSSETSGVTVNEDGSWTYTFSELPVDSSYSYSVEEKSVDGYVTTYSEVKSSTADDGTTTYAQTVTNTRSGGGELVNVTIDWDDLDDVEGLRPDSVTIVLYSNSTAIKTVTVSASDGWFGTTDLLGGTYPAYDDEGNAITYSFSVIQSGVDQYTTTYLDAVFSKTSDGLKLTSLFVHNVYRPKVSVEVSKVWDDNHDADGLRPDSLTVTLYADGEATDQTLTLTADNDWSGTFEDLDKYNEDATLIGYTVVEGEASGYELTSSEVTFDEDDDTYVITLTNSPSEDSSSTTTTTSSSSSSSSSSGSTTTSTAEEAAEVLEAEREVETVEAAAEEASEVLGTERGAGTGDSSNLLLWLLLLIMAGDGLAGVMLIVKRRNNGIG